MGWEEVSFIKRTSNQQEPAKGTRKAPDGPSRGVQKKSKRGGGDPEPIRNSIRSITQTQIQKIKGGGGCRISKSPKGEENLESAKLLHWTHLERLPEGSLWGRAGGTTESKMGGINVKDLRGRDIHPRGARTKKNERAGGNSIKPWRYKRRAAQGNRREEGKALARRWFRRSPMG